MGHTRLVLAVLAGLGLLAALAWPSLHPGGKRLQDQHYRQDLVWFQQQESAALAKYQSLRTQLEARQLSQVEFGHRLQQDIVPLWQGMIDRIAQDAVDPQSSLYESRQFLLRYSTSRRDAYTLYAKGLADGDKAALEQGKARFAEGENLIKERQDKNKTGH